MAEENEKPELEDPLSPYQPTRGLRSFDAGVFLKESSPQSEWGTAFSYYPPRLWSALPRYVHALLTFYN